jgi:hypothetical protein
LPDDHRQYDDCGQQCRSPGQNAQGFHGPDSSAGMSKLFLMRRWAGETVRATRESLRAVLQNL